MTDKLLCPFCGQELNQDDPQIIECRNDDCKKSYFLYGSKELWQALIGKKEERDTFEQHYKCLSHVFKHQIEVNDFLTDEANKLQKKLDIAVGALKTIRFRGQHSKYKCCKVSGNIADKALEQIKDKEQK